MAENANPTILAASDLPTRRPAQDPTIQSSKPHSFLFDTALPSAYPDPFNLSSTLSLSDDSDISEPEEGDVDDGAPEPIDEQEIYDLIAPISDPEHPLTLGSLAVVNLPDIFLPARAPANPRSSSSFSPTIQTVTVLLTPTITHCSLATVIGLGVRVRLERALPPRFRVDVRIKEGTHASADQVNRQLADKERVAAALENATLVGVLGKMLEGCQ
ncbi:MAG: hypothetical protein M1819_002871 [Sarea resinae]|nr:MAG: hypothetical protein M1819_002871 [Sarea resinae]